MQRAHEVWLQWIPGHNGIEGNEIADFLSKMGANKIQEENTCTIREVKSLIKAERKQTWLHAHPEYNKRDPIRDLHRDEQVAIFRLRCGHNRLRQHMYRMFKVGETDMCTCGKEKQDAAHVLQTCPRYQNEREATWPKSTTLDVKLYGSLQELRKTTAFLHLIDIHP